jgi:SulP family sulfate permease
LAAIPVAVLSAILLATGIMLFDLWSLRIVRDMLASRSLAGRLGAWQNLSVVILVMVVTVGVSTVAGVLAGVALSCLIFIVNMSRPIVRRGYRGDEVFSKRVRSDGDAAILARTGRRRAVLELEGVLFFGNAEDLSTTVRRLLNDADMVLLDLRGVTDVDVSGLAILETILSSSRKRGQTVAFCNIPGDLPSASMSTVGDAALAVAPSFPDLDSALEWMEDKTLESATESRSHPDALSIGELDLFRDFDEGDLAIVVPYLTPCEFSAGAAICCEGEDADRMWILIKGSVSIRLRSSPDRRNRRISGLAQGTTVGEIALIEGGKRSATAVADEDVMCLALDRAAFDAILRDQPKIATKLLTNIVRLMAHRMRRMTEELRVLKG